MVEALGDAEEGEAFESDTGQTQGNAAEVRLHTRCSVVQMLLAPPLRTYPGPEISLPPTYSAPPRVYRRSPVSTPGTARVEARGWPRNPPAILVTANSASRGEACTMR